VNETSTLVALAPIIVFLFFGVTIAIASRAIGLSPIVGYIALGFGFQVAGLGQLFDRSTVSLLAELGVVFLLFDIGLHFSLERIRKQASNIFAFGPFQVLFATVTLGSMGLAFGMKPGPAFLVGTALALSSTAVISRLVAERHQRNCPVGLTATSILVFQDVAAIFLLIIAGSLEDGGPIWSASIAAMIKAVLAFGITIVVSRVFIGPLLRLVAQSRNEEVFTASAILISLSAGWASGHVGLSLTLGSFLGGLSLADTPYKAVIESEIKPFRGLLLGFFFISIGLSLDVSVLVHALPIIAGLTIVFLAVKTVSNVAASRIFRWSVPGSTQLGFLLSSGSEFAFVILGLPAVRLIVGEAHTSIVFCIVTISMAVAPNLAEFGRRFAGHLRARQKKTIDSELLPQLATAPVLIIGMGMIGRTLADAMIKFGIGYYAIDRDQLRLQMAIADGYNAGFGDGSDIRLWEPMALHERKISVLTAPDLESLGQTAVMAATNYPLLRRFAVVSSETLADDFRRIGLQVIVDKRHPRGIDAAAVLLAELGVSARDIAEWTRDVTESQEQTKSPAMAA
jgi:Kef-type K+ transport system membrane component KefB